MKNYFRWKRYSPGSASARAAAPLIEGGFTLIELLVAAALGMIVIALGLASLSANRQAYKHDVVSTRVNENLRGAIDILGLNVRQAGEALVESFPAILLTDGGAGTDQLVLRRNLHENEVLNICQNITANSTTANIRFAYQTTTQGCIYSTSLVPYLAVWNAHVAEYGAEAKAYAFNRSTKQGEFFRISGGTNSGTQMYITRNDGAQWQYAYTGNGVSAAMYLLEEQRFRVVNGVLQIVKNGDTANALNVADGISDFRVTISMADGTTKTSFTTADNWTEIASFQVTISGSDTFGQKPITSSLTQRLFPRNILSN